MPVRHEGALNRGAYGAIPEQPAANSRKPTAIVKKQPSVEGLRV
jgi:hypothetical protein